MSFRFAISQIDAAYSCQPAGLRGDLLCNEIQLATGY